MTNRWQRCAGLNLLRSGSRGSPFGGGVIVVLPVFLGTRRTPGLFWDCWLGAMLAYAKLFCPLSSFFFGGRGRIVDAPVVGLFACRILGVSPAALEVPVGLESGVASCLCLVF